MTFLRMQDLDLKAKRVLIRADLNVPLKDGKITADQRLRATLPTLELALSKGAQVILMSHLGRPKEGVYDPALSLAPVARALSTLLERPVPLVDGYLHQPPNVANGELVLLENVRFNAGEKADDAALAGCYAAMADIFVMDAFGTAHRAEASTHGVGLAAPLACAGPLLSAELDALSRALAQPRRPLLAVVGGAKVSSKLTVLNSLVERVDQLIVGGGIANNFIKAAGYCVGQSLYEPSLVDEARRLIDAAHAGGGEIPIPVDVVTAKTFAAEAVTTIKAVMDVAEDDMILDIGPRTAADYAQRASRAGTVVWNGPVGVFEFPSCAEGTRLLGEAICASDAFSIAGGGDTLAALEAFGLDGVSYVSTGGGAFLEFLEGRTLPAVAMLEKAQK